MGCTLLPGRGGMGCWLRCWCGVCRGLLCRPRSRGGGVGWRSTGLLFVLGAVLGVKFLLGGIWLCSRVLVFLRFYWL